MEPKRLFNNLETRPAFGLVALAVTLLFAGCSNYLSNIHGIVSKGSKGSPGESSSETSRSLSKMHAEGETEHGKSDSRSEKQIHANHPAGHQVNLLTHEEVPSQHLAQHNGNSEFGYFKIRERGLSLSVLSSVIYGTSKRWKKIAEWNHLKAPYRIYLGQALLLKKPFKLSEEEFNERLLTVWRKALLKRQSRAPYTSREKDDSAVYAKAVKTSPITFTDTIKKIRLKDHHGIYVIRFETKVKTYHFSKFNPVAKCLFKAYDHHSDVSILARRHSRAIFQCKILTDQEMALQP